MPLAPASTLAPALASVEALNTYGCMIFMLPPELYARVPAIVETLDSDASRWFFDMLEKSWDRPLSKASLVASKAAWTALDAETQARYVRMFNLITDTGRANVFSDRARKRVAEGQAFGDFLRDSVRFVKQGNSGMALGSMSRAWTAAGFGYWAHLIPDFGLELALHAASRVREEIGVVCELSEHFPHWINKPPFGAPLNVHHDAIPTRTLIEKLATHTSPGRDNSTVAWVREHGLQLLAHLEGGTRAQNGATFTIGPMTPGRLFTCLCAVRDKEVAGAHLFYDSAKTVTSWLDSTTGVIPLNWPDYLDQFNAILRASGDDGEPLRVLPIAPNAHEQQAAGGGFFALWPMGWPHGSMKNSERRVTITVPLGIRASHEVAADRARVVDRLRALAVISSGNGSNEAFEAAEACIAQQTAPFAGGKTHLHPESAARFVRHARWSSPERPAGWFGNLAPTHTTTERFIGRFMHPEPAVHAIQPRLPGPPEPAITPSPIPLPTASPTPRLTSSVVDDPDFRVINVRQPWATLLVHGIKDVENRSFVPKMKLPAWAAIVASKNIPTVSEKEEVNRIVSQMRAGGATVNMPVGSPDTGPSGAIVGLVHFDAALTQEEMSSPRSPWYHGAPDVGWMVGDACAFTTPIEGVTGSLALRKLKNMEGATNLREALIERITHALAE